MKKKIIVLTLCFTFIFTSINYKKSYADGGIISAPILATVVSLGVASGIVLENNEQIYNLGYKFYNYVKKHNDLTWEAVKSAFLVGHTVVNNRVQVKGEFLNIVKDFFNISYSPSYVPGAYYYNYPVYYKDVNLSKKYEHYSIDFSLFSQGHDALFCPGMRFYIKQKTDSKVSVVFYKDLPGHNSNYPQGTLTLDIGVPYNFYCYYDNYKYQALIFKQITENGFVYDTFRLYFSEMSKSHFLELPAGSYNWDNVESKKENDSISLPIPGDLGNLVGQTSDKFWDNTDNLVGTGSISIPSVDNPSIGVTDDVFVGGSDIPGDIPGDVPSEGVWSNITDYIISLVVPSDAFWTDTWNTLHNNFTNNFPMVDMGNFNQLVTGEKKFPNIDINIMGVSGRVVNGDVVNSIVDWLRPIIAGFMMLCLMLFNYRKIYKTIRGVEPFQGVAQGTSDFRTGISEYNYLGSGLSKSDYDANEMELAKALHDHYEDTGKTYKVRI